MFFFFFFNDTATTEIYTLSLHDALPISGQPGTPGHADQHGRCSGRGLYGRWQVGSVRRRPPGADRKSTRLNSSHSQISYAVFCLKKKKKFEEPIYAVPIDHPESPAYQPR